MTIMATQHVVKIISWILNFAQMMGNWRKKLDFSTDFTVEDQLQSQPSRVLDKPSSTVYSSLRGSVWFKKACWRGRRETTVGRWFTHVMLYPIKCETSAVEMGRDMPAKKMVKKAVGVRESCVALT
jgi:hypothetical protein